MMVREMRNQIFRTFFIIHKETEISAIGLISYIGFIHKIRDKFQVLGYILLKKEVWGHSMQLFDKNSNNLVMKCYNKVVTIVANKI